MKPYERVGNYIAVGPTPSGYWLYRKQNSAGGWDYFTDELGGCIYQPTLFNDYDILMAMADHHRLCQFEVHERERGVEIESL